MRKKFIAHLAITSLALIPFSAGSQTVINSQTAGKDQSTLTVTSALVNRLEANTGCKPSNTKVCRFTINNAFEFLGYLKECGALVNWMIDYYPVAGQQITATADPNGFCLLYLQRSGEGESVQPQQCKLSAEQVYSMASPAAMKATRQFQASKMMPVEVMETIFKPIDDCVKSNIPERFRSMAHPNVPLINLAPPKQNGSQ